MIKQLPNCIAIDGKEYKVETYLICSHINKPIRLKVLIEGKEFEFSHESLFLKQYEFYVFNVMHFRNLN